MRIGFQKEPLKLFNSGKVGTAIMDAANFGFSYVFLCLLSCSLLFQVKWRKLSLSS